MKRKYIWIIVAAIIVAIVAGVVIGRVMPKQVTPDDLANYTEPDEYALAGKTVISSNISSETAKLVEISYTVKEEYIGAGTLWVGAAVKNKTTDRVIESASVSLRVFDGKNGTGKELKKVSDEILAIGPGKTEETGFGFIALNKLQNPKSFVVTLESVTWRGTVPNTPTTPPIITKESPSQVVKNFFTAIAEGRYTDAQKYLKNPSDIAGIKNDYEKNPSTKVVRVIILKENIDEKNNIAVVDTTLYVADGRSEDSAIHLERVGNEWRLP